MTRIYVIRHCEAQGNVKRIFQGRTDCDISETGSKQLEFLKKRFENIKLDAVYSSPLIRAYKTAQSVSFGKGLSVIKEQGLAEVDGGVIDGRPFAKVFAEHSSLAEIWDEHPEDFAPEKGEPMREAYDRIWKTVLNLANLNKGKTIAAASHGGVIRCLVCRLLYGDITRLKDTGWADNTAVTLIEFDDDMNAKLVYKYDSSHLPTELIPKRSRLSSAFKAESK